MNKAFPDFAGNFTQPICDALRRIRLIAQGEQASALNLEIRAGQRANFCYRLTRLTKARQQSGYDTAQQ